MHNEYAPLAHFLFNYSASLKRNSLATLLKVPGQCLFLSHVKSETCL